MKNFTRSWVVSGSSPVLLNKPSTGTDKTYDTQTKTEKGFTDGADAGGPQLSSEQEMNCSFLPNEP